MRRPTHMQANRARTAAASVLLALAPGVAADAPARAAGGVPAPDALAAPHAAWAAHAEETAGAVFAADAEQCPATGLCIVETRRRHELEARTSERLLAAVAPDDGGSLAESHASARFSMVLSFELEPVPGGCRLDGLALRLEAEVRLPRFVSAVRESADLRERLRALNEGLMRHERGHVAIAREHAESLLRELRTLPPRTDCSAARRDAGRQHLRHSMRHELAQQLYDARTAFGAAQGAVFHPLAP